MTVSSTAEGPVVEGDDTVSLKCDVDANPEAEITWRKEGDRYECYINLHRYFSQ